MNVGGGGGGGGNGGPAGVLGGVSVDAGCVVVGEVSVPEGAGGGAVDELLVEPVVGWFVVSFSGAGGGSVTLVGVGGIASSLLVDSVAGCVFVGESN